MNRGFGVDYLPFCFPKTAHVNQRVRFMSLIHDGCKANEEKIEKKHNPQTSDDERHLLCLLFLFIYLII